MRRAVRPAKVVVRSRARRKGIEKGIVGEASPLEIAAAASLGIVGPAGVLVRDGSALQPALMTGKKNGS